MVYEEPRKMLLYGDACRVSTDPIAKASYFFDLIQVSCSILPAVIHKLGPSKSRLKQRLIPL